MEILVRSRFLMTMAGSGLGLIEDGGLYIEDGVITAVGRYEDIRNVASKSDYYIDVRNNGVVLPGFIDAHMHTYLAILRGFAQDIPESQWMRNAIAPFTKHFSVETYRLSSLLGITEALKCGTTTFTDFMPRIGDVLPYVHKKIGVRTIAVNTINSVAKSLDETTDLYPLDEEKGYREFKYTIDLIKRYSRDRLIDVIPGPQALDMVTLNLLKDIMSYANENGLNVQMHIAQGARERNQVIKRYGDTTVKTLYKEKLLNPNLVAVHAHDATDEELALMVRHGVKLVTCMRSISMIDGVIPPLIKYIKLGGYAGLGTDQIPGNNNQCLYTELKFASILSKVYSKDPTELPAWKVLKIVTYYNARILGIDDKVGTLEEGKRGDFIILNLNKINFIPISTYPIKNLIYNIVYASYGDEVEYVFIDGKPMMENRRLKTLDEYKIFKEVGREASKLLDEASEDYISLGNMLLRYDKMI